MSCIGHPPGAPGPCECERACVCARVSECSGGRRQHIRSHMREVMEQLEYVLAELKDVARELQEVVGQIDKLTGDMPLDADTDQSIAASSSCSTWGLCQRTPSLVPEQNSGGASLSQSPLELLKDSRRLSDRELHALCCDDDDDDDEEEVEGRSSGLRSSRLSSSDSVFSSTPPPRPLPLATLTPSQRRRTQRSCSTQTVSDKSTQTA
ncbi:hypothetical protein AALO_G00154720 [Alosa alosa]|uniref:Inhibitory synaptic factor 1 n=1 Tax=Alosa alosa TaxID=278164 RepID=A0AAV6GIT9_9TELE|nr:hypothetical protein AALO_G00154720 [Alosa alosa]